MGRRPDNSSVNFRDFHGSVEAGARELTLPLDYGELKLPEAPRRFKTPRPRPQRAEAHEEPRARTELLPIDEVIAVGAPKIAAAPPDLPRNIDELRRDFGLHLLREKGFQLRGYQLEAIIDFQRDPRPLIVEAPTGSGKTFIGCGVLLGPVGRHLRGLYITPERHLAYQARRNLLDMSTLAPDEVCVLSGRIGPDGRPEEYFNPRHRVFIATPEVLVNDLPRLPDTPVAIIDEIDCLLGNYAYRKLIAHVRSEGALIYSFSGTPVLGERHMIDLFEVTGAREVKRLTVPRRPPREFTVSSQPDPDQLDAANLLENTKAALQIWRDNKFSDPKQRKYLFNYEHSFKAGLGMIRHLQTAALNDGRYAFLESCAQLIWKVRLDAEGAKGARLFERTICADPSFIKAFERAADHCGSPFRCVTEYRSAELLKRAVLKHHPELLFSNSDIREALFEKAFRFHVEHAPDDASRDAQQIEFVRRHYENRPRDQVIVFARLGTRARLLAARITHQCRDLGLKFASVMGGEHMTPLEQEAAFDAFDRRTVHGIVGTSILNRGLHSNANFGIIDTISARANIHEQQVGRVGRMGQRGIVMNCQVRGTPGEFAGIHSKRHKLRMENALRNQERYLPLLGPEE